MFLSRITAFHGIAVKWYLRVYWLLPLSTDDSFAEHRRFFCREPTTLLLSTINTWTSQSTSFPKGVISCFHQTLFSLHQLKQQTAWQKSYGINRHSLQEPILLLLLTKRSYQNPGVLLGYTKTYACSIGWRASTKRNLSLDRHPARRETIAGPTIPVTFWAQ